MYLHLVCSCISSCKNLIVKYKVEGKRKKQEGVQVFLRCFSLLRAAVFFLPYPFFLLFCFFLLPYSRHNSSAWNLQYSLLSILFFLNINSMDSRKVMQVHTGVIYERHTFTYEWHTTTYEWHTSGTQVHRMSYKYIYQWHISDMQVHTKYVLNFASEHVMSTSPTGTSRQLLSP